MLDSNVIIDFIRRGSGVAAYVLHYPQRSLVISHVTYVEVMAGSQLHRKEDTAKFLRGFTVVPFTEKAHLKSIQLAKKVHVNKPMDLLLAAHAMSMDCIFTTANTKDFARYPGLRLEAYPGY